MRMTYYGGTVSLHSLEFYSNFSPEGVGSRVSYHCALLELFLFLKSTKFVIIIYLLILMFYKILVI